MLNKKLDRLDEIAARCAQATPRQEPLEALCKSFWSLSSGERCYVGLAANNSHLLNDAGYTMLEAFTRLDSEWRRELLKRWSMTTCKDYVSIAECQRQALSKANI